MRVPLYQVDAFATHVFGGNPAAVCPLQSWLPEALMQSIAMENQLSETAFFVSEGEAFGLRWFTPVAEVDLCGHATLASAHVLFEHLEFGGERITFQTKSGALEVERVASGYRMDFPAEVPTPVEAPDFLEAALGAPPLEVRSATDLVVRIESERVLRALRPEFRGLARVQNRGVLVTAPGEEHDFVSRCFFPALGIDEDPVTGSAHCQLAPLWAERLGRTRLRAAQRSARGGELECELAGDRVRLVGAAVDYLRGEIEVPG